MVYHKKYNFSFTSASALIAETLVIAEEFDRLKDWNKVQEILMKDNLLNKSKKATFKREFTEVKKRLTKLTPDQLYLMINGSSEDARAMILLALVKAYAFVRDFIVEVVRHKYFLYDKTLLSMDYTKFFNSKSIAHDELVQISELTAKKVKQVVFKLLEQTGLITQAQNGIIIKPFLSAESIRVIMEDDSSLLTVFLYSNQDIQAMKEQFKNA